MPIPGAVPLGKCVPATKAPTTAAAPVPCTTLSVQRCKALQERCHVNSKGNCVSGSQAPTAFTPAPTVPCAKLSPALCKEFQSRCHFAAVTGTCAPGSSAPTMATSAPTLPCSGLNVDQCKQQSSRCAITATGCMPIASTPQPTSKGPCDLSPIRCKAAKRCFLNVDDVCEPKTFSPTTQPTPFSCYRLALARCKQESACRINADNECVPKPTASPTEFSCNNFGSPVACCGQICASNPGCSFMQDNASCCNAKCAKHRTCYWDGPHKMCAPLPA
jgi:hypothetical protein